MRELEQWAVAYLLNSLWQVPLFWLAAVLVARVMRPWGPGWQHRVWVGALLLEVSMPAVSARWGAVRGWAWMEARLPAWMAHAGGAEGRVTVTLGPARALGALPVPDVVLRLCSVGFGVVLLFCVLRLSWRFVQTQGLRRDVRVLALEGEAARTWRRCSVRFRIEGATLGESGKVGGPLTLGVRRRLVLLPTGLLGALSETELLTVFAHECAHLRRGDFAKNLVYEALALPVAWHPLYWATRGRLVESREWVCDAMAAEAAASGAVYARSLLRLASLLLEGAPVKAPHALGIFEANTLERRVMHLTKSSKEMGFARRLMALAMGVAVCAGACGSAWALSARVTGTMAQTETGVADPGARVVHVSGGVMAGNLLSQVHPVYPQEAKDAGMEGAVVLAAVIGTDGNLSSLRLVSGTPELAKAAWAAVTQWVYKPYLLNGEPTAVETTITVNFQLQH